MADHDEQFDYIVVGAGSAGCVVARRLLEGTGARVLVLEAGGPPDGIESISDPTRWVENLGAPHDWAYGYSPTPHTRDRGQLLSRGKVLGGSGSTNALVWSRGHRADYDGWAALGNPGWDYESVLPYFKRAEDWEDGASALRGAGGPIHVERATDLHPVAAALIDSGLSYGMPYLDDINVAEPVGVGPVSTNVRAGRRVSTWTGYLEPVRDHERLTLRTGVRVTGLTFSGSRCTGVEYVQDGRVGTAAGANVVLTAGAIDTPRLLMLAGIGDSDELRRAGIEVRQHLPGVGGNLHEHVILGGLCFAAAAPLPPPNNNLEGSIAFWSSRSGLARPDLMFVAVQIPLLSPEIADAYPAPPNAFTLAPGLGGVRSSGRISPTGASPDSPLVVQPNMLADPADVEALVAAVEIGYDLAAQPGFGKLIDSWVAPPRRFDRAGIEEFVRLAASPYWHPVGTCAMGTGPDAVVDSDLRVHGVEGLTVADASVMPTTTSGFTHAATVMIAERASDLLIRT